MTKKDSELKPNQEFLKPRKYNQILAEKHINKDMNAQIFLKALKFYQMLVKQPELLSNNFWSKSRYDQKRFKIKNVHYAETFKPGFLITRWWKISFLETQHDILSEVFC